MSLLSRRLFCGVVLPITGRACPQFVRQVLLFPLQLRRALCPSDNGKDRPGPSGQNGHGCLLRISAVVLSREGATDGPHTMAKVEKAVNAEHSGGSLFFLSC